MLREDLSVRVRAAEAAGFTEAEFEIDNEPSEADVLWARSVTSRSASWFAKVVEDTFEVDAVANHIPVLPKKVPEVSVEPETTVRVSAY